VYRPDSRGPAATNLGRSAARGLAKLVGDRALSRDVTLRGKRCCLGPVGPRFAAFTDGSPPSPPPPPVIAISTTAGRRGSTQDVAIVAALLRKYLTILNASDSWTTLKAIAVQASNPLPPTRSHGRPLPLPAGEVIRRAAAAGKKQITQPINKTVAQPRPLRVRPGRGDLAATRLGGHGR